MLKAGKRRDEPVSIRFDPPVVTEAVVAILEPLVEQELDVAMELEVDLLELGEVPLEVVELLVEPVVCEG